VLLVPFVAIPLVAGVVAAAVVLRWPRVDPASPRVIRHSARKVEAELVDERGWRSFVTRRTNAEVATGLLLTVALLVTFAGAVVVAVLAVLVHSDSAIVSVDHDISQWAAEHGGRAALDVLAFFTHFGATEYVVPIAVVVLIVEYRRRPSHWIAPFLAVVLIGQSILTNGIKALLDRVRPDLNPAAHLLGPSFPSGHTATAAAFWAAVALLVGRGRGRVSHSVLAGVAVALGVAVACTRVLLDVHWFSDVVAGLALGWAWFAVCSIAFGGRLLRFGAPVEAAERAVGPHPSVPAGAAEVPRPTVGVEQERVQRVEHGPRRG
jgi:undecaprenyl-diphosphatase